jgi:hypothetical protein
MSRDKLTFYRYITNYNSANIDKFIELFENTIEKIPDRMVSSKYIIELLNINTNTIQFRAFQNVFMDYFKLILN